MRCLLLLTGATAATAAYVPGKIFDRFITIWLENQVCLSVSSSRRLVVSSSLPPSSPSPPLCALFLPPTSH